MTDQTPSRPRPAGTDRTDAGDARPDNTPDDPRTRGSLPQENVDDRENVSTVTPEDYPADDRALSQPK